MRRIVSAVLMAAILVGCAEQIPGGEGEEITREARETTIVDSEVIIDSEPPSITGEWLYEWEFDEEIPIFLTNSYIGECGGWERHEVFKILRVAFNGEGVQLDYLPVSGEEWADEVNNYVMPAGYLLYKGSLAETFPVIDFFTEEMWYRILSKADFEVDETFNGGKYTFASESVEEIDENGEAATVFLRSTLIFVEPLDLSELESVQIGGTVLQVANDGEYNILSVDED
jgi:hypothetical protein